MTRGPRLTSAGLFVARTCAGVWHRCTIGPMPVAEALTVEALTGVYFLLDRDASIVRFGQACREDGVAGRIRDHLRLRERAALVDRAVIVALDDFCPPGELDLIEGRVADSLGLRGAMPGLRWPAATRRPAHAPR